MGTQVQVLTWAAQAGAEQVDREWGHVLQEGSLEQQGVEEQMGLVQGRQEHACLERMAGHHTDLHTCHQRDHPAQAGGPGLLAHAFQVQQAQPGQEQGQRAQVQVMLAQEQQMALEQANCQWALAQNLLEQQVEQLGHLLHPTRTSMQVQLVEQQCPPQR